MQDFYQKRVMIVGEGVSGRGAFNALVAHGANCFFYSEVDDFERSIDLIVVSPGVPTDSEVFNLARRIDCPIIGEIELGYLLCKKPIIAITGTNGKTTITELIGAILGYDKKRALVCGNIGTAFSSAVIEENFDVAVVEVSSFQLQTIVSFRPHIAIISNITEDHLDRHKSMKKYIEAKLKIFKNQTAQDHLIITPKLLELIDGEKIKPSLHLVDILWEGEKKYDLNCFAFDERIFYEGGYIVNVNEISIRGEHNLYNALFAIAACKLLGVSDEAIRLGLKLFMQGSYRIALVGEHNGKKYFNDSKGTNIDACLCACRAMDGETCLIVGGSDKGYDFDRLFEELPNKIVKIFAVGETAERIVGSAKRKRYNNIEIAETIASAALAASKLDLKNILLSPAAASFDSYSSYLERGRDFDNIVGEIMQIDSKAWTL